MKDAGGRQPQVPEAGLIRELTSIRSHILRLDRRHPVAEYGSREVSAQNLVDYLALRRYDLRGLQEDLGELGLSSLGRAESHVRYNLDAVLSTLYRLSGRSPPRFRAGAYPDPISGSRLLASNTVALFGSPRAGRRTRIMVTAPGESATEYRLIRGLIEAGMDCLRINCAHDSPPEWAGMIRNTRRASRELGQRCLVEMDLSGPRVRTGPLPADPGVVKLRPTRDSFGRVVEPARAWLVAPGAAPKDTRGVMRIISLSRGWSTVPRVGAHLWVVDARGRKRRLRVIRGVRDACLVEVKRTVYLSNGTLVRSESKRRKPGRIVGRLSVPDMPGALELHVGDYLRLTTTDARPPSATSPRGKARRRTARIGVIPPEALAGVRSGDRVLFDGGRISGVVRSVATTGVLLRITRAGSGGSKLRSEKGINLPDSRLELDALTAKDLEDLRFVVRYADIAGCSFVQGAADVAGLRDALQRLEAPDLPIILKIETARGFDHLPAILLAALRAPCAGVMIARGDLAVEVGYERLAEVQEEILWLCEAAHLPAIWATQVLEELTRTGMPSRAEITDAAMGERAECVMLNKGPHLIEAVRVLDDILRRMEAHQAKKSSRLRHLRVAEEFFRTHRRVRTDSATPKGP